MIALADYGAGNLMSVTNALRSLGAESARASSPEEILAARAVILPGVGEFGSAAAELERRGLDGALRAAAGRGTPLLGICLGMQLLFESSEESPGAAGLSVLPGRCRLLRGGNGLKIPHMGWNTISMTGKSRLLAGIPEDSYMYFVHSFYVEAAERGDVSAVTCYGTAFDSAVERGNVFGCQFHPEKSGAAGLAILKNFIAIAEGAQSVCLRKE